MRQEITIISKDGKSKEIWVPRSKIETIDNTSVINVKGNVYLFIGGNKFLEK
jgi:hypothetical protein